VQLPVKLLLELSHRRRAWDIFAMHERRRIKVTGREHSGYVVKVTTDLIAGLRICCVVGTDVDIASIFLYIWHYPER